jgi:kumamolisin
MGPVDPNQSIDVTIYLRPRTAAGELAAQAAAMGAQPPRQRTYLTPDQYSALYGASPTDMEKVVAFVRHHGLKVVSTSVAARTVTASGTAHAMEAAFHVELKQYTSLHGPYRGCDGPVEIPIELRHIIEGVFGLDDREQASWTSSGATGESSAAVGSAEDERIARGEYDAFRSTALAVVLIVLVVLAALILLLR